MTLSRDNLPPSPRPLDENEANFLVSAVGLNIVALSRLTVPRSLVEANETI